jgi:hypothetical protein
MIKGDPRVINSAFPSQEATLQEELLVSLDRNYGSGARSRRLSRVGLKFRVLWSSFIYMAIIGREY